MSTERRQRGILTLRIDKAKEYFSADPGVGMCRCSQSITLCGAKWTLEAYRCGSYLGIRIRCAERVALEYDWRFSVSSAVRVRRSKAEDDIEFINAEISKESTSGAVQSSVSIDVSRFFAGFRIASNKPLLTIPHYTYPRHNTYYLHP